MKFTSTNNLYKIGKYCSMTDRKEYILVKY